MNPCPCGYRDVENPKQICTCSAVDVQRYKKKLSGPLLDRIDMFIHINPVKHADLVSKSKEETSATIKKRIEKSRKIQAKRFSGMQIQCNAEMRNKEIEKICVIDKETKALLATAVERMNLSARGYFRILKLARTIADLAGEDKIQSRHVAEALNYKNELF